MLSLSLLNASSKTTPFWWIRVGGKQLRKVPTWSAVRAPQVAVDIKKTLVSLLCCGSSQALSPKLSESWNDEVELHRTHTAAAPLIFFAHSLQLFLFSLLMFLCVWGTHTHTLMVMCLCVFWGGKQEWAGWDWGQQSQNISELKGFSGRR